MQMSSSPHQFESYANFLRRRAARHEHAASVWRRTKFELRGPRRPLSVSQLERDRVRSFYGTSIRPASWMHRPCIQCGDRMSALTTHRICNLCKRQPIVECGSCGELGRRSKHSHGNMCQMCMPQPWRHVVLRDPPARLPLSKPTSHPAYPPAPIRHSTDRPRPAASSWLDSPTSREKEQADRLWGFVSTQPETGHLTTQPSAAAPIVSHGSTWAPPLFNPAAFQRIRNRGSQFR